MLVLGTLLLIVGWFALMASSGRHPEVFGTLSPASHRRLRVAAWAALAASLPAFIAGRGMAQGWVYWAVALMLAAMVTALVATWVAWKSGRASR